MEFNNKCLLITGGTGSFGNAVLRRFLDTDIGEIRIFSRDEKKQDDMRQFYKNSKIKYFIGDVRNMTSLDAAMHGVDYIFHAAALKQVPSCEFFPAEAVRTNVMGCENVLNSALKHDVKRVVTLSTDKAVYPVNAMGMSKALSEKIMIAQSRNLNSSGVVFCGTRYGNVLASRGSVVPLFINQIKNRQPLTVTDPNMTRFLMTLEEAVELVVFAFRNGNNGDIFVRKSPATTIGILAQAVKELYKSDLPVKIIGTRHAEKLFETLVNREDMVKAVDEGDFFRIPADTRDLNYNKYFTEGEARVSDTAEYTSHNTYQMDLEETKELLMKLRMIREDVLMEKGEMIFEP
ncbi:MAG: polysaccharide biosynthesis protein [Bacteroidetes bacterium]|nr:polysaccharide biosynthesis protein [Bacteroidota bacterium]